jgi:hypothetical protein
MGEWLVRARRNVLWWCRIDRTVDNPSDSARLHARDTPDLAMLPLPTVMTVGTSIESDDATLACATDVCPVGPPGAAGL